MAEFVLGSHRQEILRNEGVQPFAEAFAQLANTVVPGLAVGPSKNGVGKNCPMSPSSVSSSVIINTTATTTNTSTHPVKTQGAFKSSYRSMKTVTEDILNSNKLQGPALNGN